MSLEEKHRESSSDPDIFWERLDIFRREVIKLCGEKGIALFTFLLTSSTIDPDQGNRAILSLSYLRDVATRLRWSPDTVKRYVAVFRSLNLVSHHHDQHRGIQLHLPLGPYTPLTTLTALDELANKRTKQRQLAQKVKLRYITRFGDPTQGYSDEIHTKFQELNIILEGEHLEPPKRQRLQMKIADLLTRLSDTQGDSMGDPNITSRLLQTTPSSSESSVHTGKGDPNGGQEASYSAEMSILGQKPSQEGDLNQLEGDLIPHHTPSSQHQSRQMGNLKQLKGDLILHHTPPSQHRPQQMGDSNKQLGDLITDASSEIGHPSEKQEFQEYQEGDQNTAGYSTNRNIHYGKWS